MAVATMVLAGWRGPLGHRLKIGLRLPLPGEQRGDVVAAAPAEVPVRIGERFARFEGAPGTSGGSWPCFRGPLRDNVARDAGRLAETWPAGGPRRLWSVPLGEGYAGPVIHGGRVYLLDYDGATTADMLRCFSMEDGRELWRRGYGVKVKRNHGMSRTVPAVTDEYVVTLGPRCHVMCVDAVTGDFRWGLDLATEWGVEEPMWYAGQCPLIADGQAVLGVGGTCLMMGVDLATGKVAWQTPNPRGWKMSHSSVAPMEFAGRKLYVYAAVGGIVGVSAEGADRGAPLWETGEWNVPVVAPSPVPFGEGRFLMTSGYGAGSAMFELAESAGRFSVKRLFPIPKQGFACEQQTPVFFEGCLYTVMPADAGAARKQVACMDRDGRVLWTSGGADRFGLGPFMIADGKLLVLEDNGTLTLARVSARGYEKLAQAKVLDGKEAWAPMALADGRLLVRDYGELRCLDLR
jgi:outer membrane protein assembly factor BamB